MILTYETYSISNDLVKAEKSGSPVKTATDSISSTGESVKNVAADSVDTATGSIGTTADSAIKTVTDSMRSATSGLTDFGSKIYNGVKSAGSNIISRLPIIGGIRVPVGTARNQENNVAGATKGSADKNVEQGEPESEEAGEEAGEEEEEEGSKPEGQQKQ